MNNLITEISHLINGRLRSDGDSEVSPFHIDKNNLYQVLNGDLVIPEDILKNLEYVFYIFDLNLYEKRIITLLVLYEMVPNFDKIIAFLNKDISRNQPTVGFFTDIFPDERSEIVKLFSESSKLENFGIVESGDESNLPFIYRSVRLSDILKRFILSGNCFSREIDSFVSFFPHSEDFKIDERYSDLIKRIDERRAVFYLTGNNRHKKKRFSRAVSSARGFSLIVVNNEFFRLDDIDRKINELFISSFLMGSCIMFEDLDSITGYDSFYSLKNTLKACIKKFSWLTFIDSPKNRINFDIEDFEHIKIDFKYPSTEERIDLWNKYLDLDGSISYQISVMLKLDEEEIISCAKKINLWKCTQERISGKGVIEYLYSFLTEDFGPFVERYETTARLEDIVLPDYVLKKIKMIISHYKNRYTLFKDWKLEERFINRSFSVLFTGEPGTGKSMTASIIANELDLPIYRVDLSKVVSKYIGETEKNLQKVFEYAEKFGFVLFFDEADSIFGKRTEIKDAHDRFANFEVSYLLQKIENYDGLVILSTNFKKNIDHAFLRRFRYVVDFPFPDEKLRHLIWKKTIPEGFPLSDDIDLEKISKYFRLSGGNIKNAFLYSAFIAKEKGSEVGIVEILEGIKLELEKSGKTFNMDQILKELTGDYEDEYL